MTVRFVKAGGSGTNADWAGAYATMAAAITASAAGDVFWVSSAHSETPSSALSLTFKGTLASPNRVLCVVESGASGISGLSNTAVIGTSGANALTLVSGNVYYYGIIFRVGVSQSSGSCIININTSASLLDEAVCFENCSIENQSNSSGAIINIGGNGTLRARFVNTNFRFGNAGSRIAVANSRVSIEGGAAVSGTTTPTTQMFLGNGGRGMQIDINGFDFSNFSSSLVVFNPGSAVNMHPSKMRNCRMPTSWASFSTAVTPIARSESNNADTGSTIGRLWVEDYCGTITNENTIVRTGGASDGTTGISWKMVSNANAEYPLLRLESGEIVAWNELTGSRTVTVEIIHSGVGAGASGDFRDDEIWLEVVSLDSASYVVGALTSTMALPETTPADHANSSETWASSPATPVKQYLQAAISPDLKGYISCRVVLAQASKTVYIDPKLTVA